MIHTVQSPHNSEEFLNPEDTCRNADTFYGDFNSLSAVSKGEMIREEIV